MLTSILIERSLEFCMRSIGKTREEIISGLALENRETHSWFRYGLAKYLCACINELDEGMIAAYVHGSTASDTAGIASDIDLIIIISGEEEYLIRILKSLDHHLVDSYRKLVGVKAEFVSRLLDVKITTNKARKDSMGNCPIRIWEASLKPIA
ncbi:MAG: nucleotidyltransferase domain-containing protein [Syntrophomonadaceae bacterium]|nr:nucleotidyltransferase domain-containing protein [Syntrophomonadaceae bacterium]